MKSMRLLFGCLLVVFCPLLSPGLSAQTREDFVKWMNEQVKADRNQEQYWHYFKEAEYRFSMFQFENSIRECENALSCNPKDPLIRAMMCLNYYMLSEQLSVKKKADREKKLKIYEKMIAISDEGIKYAPDRGECYFMRGLANARFSTTKGILSSVMHAKKVENDWLTAVKHPSNYVSPFNENMNAYAYLALGTYYRLCPTFFLFKFVFHISGNLDKAVEYCLKAYEINPERIEILKELGISYVTRGLKRENQQDILNGKKYLEKAVSLPPCSKTDKLDKEHCRMILNNVQLGPGYSRDQQQDISEETLLKKLKKY